jgi:ubiquinone/menaquinone biosynthesis C-methylase UbiE
LSGPPGAGLPSADPWSDADAVGNIELLERRLETRIGLPYYAAALETALGLASGQPREVADLGCGSGATSRWLAQRLPAARVTGLDRSARLIAAAERRAAEAGADDRVRFVVADAARTGLPEESFDLVFAATLLEHILEPAAIVAELARLCRPGGEVVVLAQDYETLILNCPGQSRALTRRLHNAFVDGFAHPWAGRAVGGWLAAAGLIEIKQQASATVETGTSQPFLDYLGQMMRTLTVERGVATEQELAGWLASLDQANASGAFFLNWEFFCWRGAKRG